MIISSHNLELIYDVSSRIILLDSGRIIKDVVVNNTEQRDEINTYFKLQKSVYITFASLLSKTYICYDKYIKKKNDSLCLDKTSLLLGIGNVIYIKIMTEREKMLAGEIYDCGDEQLIERWHLAKQLQKSILRLTAETEIL